MVVAMLWFIIGAVTGHCRRAVVVPHILQQLPGNLEISHLVKIKYSLLLAEAVAVSIITLVVMADFQDMQVAVKHHLDIQAAIQPIKAQQETVARLDKELLIPGKPTINTDPLAAAAAGMAAETNKMHKIHIQQNWFMVTAAAPAM